ncbi:MAG: universal stress protein [Spirochaetota bacterium]|nr:universal stress protein [Spirochaetota bacterium]
MFKKVLYPTDFSANSEKVMPYVKELKNSGTDEIILLHIIDTRNEDFIKKGSWASQTIQNELMKDYHNNMIKEAEKKIEPIKKELDASFKVKTIITSGIPFQKIIDTAEEENVSVIAMGSHGISNIAEMVLGSVTELVFRKTCKPILVIKR